MVYRKKSYLWRVGVMWHYVWCDEKMLLFEKKRLSLQFENGDTVCPHSINNMIILYLL